jgi:hypothetical protein
MGGILQVDTIQNNNTSTLITQTNATTITVATSGQTIIIPSGVTFNASSASVNLPAVSLTTGVTGTLPVANGGTGLTALGTSLQVLRTNTGATALEYYTPTVASSDYVLLATSTISSNVSSVSIDGYFSSTYTSYKIIFYGVFGSTTTSMLLRFNRSGSAISTSNYNYAGFSAYASVPSTRLDPLTNTNSSSAELGSYYTAVDRSLSGFVEINNPLSTTAYKMALTFGSSYYYLTNLDTQTNGQGVVLKDSTSALSGFTFLANGGTLNGGTFKIYGIK